jgi:alkylated DNA repair dioxygenase AlkB
MTDGTWAVLPLPGADMRLCPGWLGRAEADALLVTLREAIAWENHRIRLFGRELPSPRLSCWIGDPGTRYTYSRTRFEPRPWPRSLLDLRHRVERACDARFNSVLANLYRDGDDAMGWHSDDEPELGPTPVIASLSLGATRRFRLRPKRAKAAVERVASLRIELEHGSLLRMAGDTQRNYQHALPRERLVRDARINLTFRWIDTSSRAGLAG